MGIDSITYLFRLNCKDESYGKTLYASVVNFCFGNALAVLRLEAIAPDYQSFYGNSKKMNREPLNLFNKVCLKNIKERRAGIVTS